MTLGTTINIAKLLTNGVATEFPFYFTVFAKEHLTVLLRDLTGEVIKTYAQNEFSVSGLGAVAGSVAISPAPVNNHEIVIYRSVPLTQTTDIVNQGGFFPEVVEERFDLLTMQNQQLDEKLSRAFVAPVGDPPYSLEIFSNELAVPAQEAAAQAAISAAFAEEFSGPAYDTISAGEAATTTGQFFRVSAGGTPRTYTRYQRTSGGSVEAASLATTVSLAASGGTGLLGHIAAFTGAVARTVADWFSDRPSVMDFIPLVERVKIRLRTSTADLAPYFQAASNAGRCFEVPEGSYRLAQSVSFNQRVTFMPGAKLYRDGGTLAFSGGVNIPFVEQVFFGYVYPQIDINNTLSPEGWVDWFGYDVNGIETCHRIFRVNLFGNRDYFTDRTIIFDRSYREVTGTFGSAEGAGGSRIVMIGAAAANQPVIQVGTLNTTNVLSCARRLNIRGINTIRAGSPYQPVASNRREDAIPGWNIKGWYESRMDDCFDYGSAIHYKINATPGCTLNRCGGVRPDAGAVNGNTDFYTAFVVGGSSTSFGFIGANASLTIENCGTAGGVGAERMGLYLYGYIGDTWIKKFEMSQLEYGIVVDGRDAAGAMITAESAHQDVRILECVLDALLFRGLWIRSINEGGHVTVNANYIALNAAGDAALVQDCDGAVSFNNEDYIGNSNLANFGMRIVTSDLVTVSPSVKLKNFRVGLRAESTGPGLHVEPTIHRSLTGGTNGVELAGASRPIVKPIISGRAGAYDYGIVSDSATNFGEINISGINPGCFTTVSATRKIWHNGATWGGGGTFGNNNIATGVLT
jgi:hypothetical protein